MHLSDYGNGGNIIFEGKFKGKNRQISKKLYLRSVYMNII